MKTILLTLILALVSLTGFSQKEEYYQAMGESLAQYATCRSIEDFQALGNKFNMIAKAEKEEWLPFYYHAQCYIIMSFMEPSDATKKDAYLDAAEKSITRMIELAPAEADVHALQAMFFSGRLVVSPMERGQEFGMRSGQAVGQALGIDPTNPRARMIKIQNDMGAARFYGKDVKAFCEQAKALLADWDNFKPKSPLHPNWGKQQVSEIVDSCN
ncbi:MAG: hypothetical protein CVU14_00515 [Bacteroidetes bacterium HGW-Bacteroidetes-9]|jgi:hypothetical protein|nr:MAG: hypothetical protein CVU14_00515 [Bacteroidetes bacterium HGW-Bacteroidetes-9]